MGNSQAQPSIFDITFQLKMTKKQLERQSKKSTADMNKNKALVKKYIEQRDPETARIYAENAIRKKSESLNYLRMAGRIDATISRLESVQQIKTVSKQLGTVVKGMEHAMKSMNLEEISAVMDKFESQFEALDVHSKTLEDGIGATMHTSAPEEQIDSLLQEVGTEHGLDIADMFDDAQVPTAETVAQKPVGALSQKDENALEARLAQLRE